MKLSLCNCRFQKSCYRLKLWSCYRHHANTRRLCFLQTLFLLLPCFRFYRKSNLFADASPTRLAENCQRLNSFADPEHFRKTWLLYAFGVLQLVSAVYVRSFWYVFSLETCYPKSETNPCRGLVKQIRSCSFLICRSSSHFWGHATIFQNLASFPWENQRLFFYFCIQIDPNICLVYYLVLHGTGQELLRRNFFVSLPFCLEQDDLRRGEKKKSCREKKSCRITNVSIAGGKYFANSQLYNNGKKYKNKIKTNRAIQNNRSNRILVSYNYHITSSTNFWMINTYLWSS